MILRAGFPQFPTGEDEQTASRTQTPPPSHSLGSPHPPFLQLTGVIS